MDPNHEPQADAMDPGVIIADDDEPEEEEEEDPEEVAMVKFGMFLLDTFPLPLLTLGL